VDVGRETPLEQVSVQQEFEDLMDKGAASGPGWDQVMRVLQHSDVDSPDRLESTTERQTFSYIFEGGLPYRTSAQQQQESTEPRLDSGGDELSPELEMDLAVQEGLDNTLEYTAITCRRCKKERPPKGHHHRSVCPTCVATIADHHALEIHTNTVPLEVGWWYRCADELDVHQEHHMGGRVGMKIQPCCLCNDTSVYIPSSERFQFCRGAKDCRSFGIVETTRVLGIGSRYIRVLREYVSSPEGVDDLVSSTVERFPPEPGASSEELEPHEPDTSDPDTHIPLAEITEVPRMVVEDTTGYEIRRIRGCRRGSYEVEWSSGEVTQVTYTGLFGCAESVADYWRSVTGHNRLRTWSKGTLQYENWVAQVQGSTAALRDIAHLVSLQLTDTRGRTLPAVKRRLQEKGDFLEHTLFQVWVIPTALCHSLGHTAIPLLDIPYKALPFLVNPSDWPEMNGRLRDTIRRLALHTDVPMVWWHTPDQDLEWGINQDELSGHSRAWETVFPDK